MNVDFALGVRFESFRIIFARHQEGDTLHHVYCGECGSLYLHRGKTIRPENNNFQCGGFQTRTKKCTAHYIRESVLDQIVLQNLKMVTAFAREQPDEFYEMALRNGEKEAEKFYETAEREKVQLESRIRELDNIIQCLYEDRVCGRVTPGRYDVMAGGYEQEQAELRQELKSITARINEMDMREMCIREFIGRAQEYIEMPKDLYYAGVSKRGIAFVTH